MRKKKDPVARARGLLANATPGPWAKGVEGPDEETPYPNYCVLANTGKVVEPIGDYLSEYDAEFCAAARDLVPELCEEVERLRAELADSRDFIRGLFRGWPQRKAKGEPWEESEIRYWQASIFAEVAEVGEAGILTSPGRWDLAPGTALFRIARKGGYQGALEGLDPGPDPSEEGEVKADGE